MSIPLGYVFGMMLATAPCPGEQIVAVPDRVWVENLAWQWCVDTVKEMPDGSFEVRLCGKR